MSSPAVHVVGVGRPLLVWIPETRGESVSVSDRAGLTCSKYSICYTRAQPSASHSVEGGPGEQEGCSEYEYNGETNLVRRALGAEDPTTGPAVVSPLD